MLNKFFLLIVVGSMAVWAQSVTVPADLTPDPSLSAALTDIVHRLDIDHQFATEDGPENISFAVVALTPDGPKLGGVHADSFIYPASVYKMYVASEVLHQVREHRYFLTSPVIVRSPNDVDTSPELEWDPRPLLRDGDTVTVGYLLDLMITRSDNSAANCLIDLAQRKNINALLDSYHWNGSEVTRKYLSRKFEDPGYDTVRSTVTCALHAADFMYRIYSNRLVDPWVSMQMKSLFGRQLDTTKLFTGLPPDAMFYHKTGWYSSWTHDVGIVDDGTVKYIIACFLPIEEQKARPIMNVLSDEVYRYVRKTYFTK